MGPLPVADVRFFRTESGRHAESPLSVSRQCCLPQRRDREDRRRDADRQLARSEHKPANAGILWLSSFQFLGASRLCFVVYYPLAPISDLPTGGQCISWALLLQPHVFTRGETRQTCESTTASPRSRCHLVTHLSRCCSFEHVLISVISRTLTSDCQRFPRHCVGLRDRKDLQHIL